MASTTPTTTCERLIAAQFIQRRWQQRRQELTIGLVQPFFGRRILNVGCGSARMNLDLPGAIGVDVVQPKLRYLKRFLSVITSAAAVTSTSCRFQTIILIALFALEVIEHILARWSADSENCFESLSRQVVWYSVRPDYGTKSVANHREALWVAPAWGICRRTRDTHYTENSLTEELV